MLKTHANTQAKVIKKNDNYRIEESEEDADFGIPELDYFRNNGYNNWDT